jgi:hypothetical protein
MPKAKEKGKGKRNLDAFFVGVKSINDLARHSCSFSNAISTLFVVRIGEGFRLLSIGEKVGDANNVYYFDMEKVPKFIVYNPMGKEESITMEDGIGGDMQNFREYRIQLLELANNPFKEAKKASVIQFNVKDCDALIRGTLSKAAGDERFGTAYLFDCKGKRYLGVIESIDSNGNTAMMFNAVENNANFNFIRYNYANDKTERLVALEENLYNSLRVISLTSPFPFFKPE